MGLGFYGIMDFVVLGFYGIMDFVVLWNVYVFCERMAMKGV